MSKPKITFYWRCQQQTGERLLYLWLIRRDGAAESGMLFGNVDRQTADEIKEAIPLEWKEECFTGHCVDEPRPRPVVQPDLFDRTNP